MTGLLGARSTRLATVALSLVGWTLLVSQTCPPPSGGDDVLSPYHGQVANDAGAAVADATVTVRPTGSPSTLASLFADAAGQVAKANPVHVDAQGRYDFFVESGTYNIEIAGTGVGVATTLVNVSIVDPRRAHAIGGSSFQAPVTLVESSNATGSGNAALLLDRLRDDGSRVYGPWSLHVNKGPSDRKAGIRWMYNVDWNEVGQAPSFRITPDVALAMRWAPRGPLQTSGTQPFEFAYDYAPAAAAGTTPAFTTLISMNVGKVGNGQTLPMARLGGGPFVVSDGLENSSLVAPRLGWFCSNQTAPSGVLTRVDTANASPCTSNPVVCNPCPGDVVVVQRGSATRTTQPAQQGATVYIHGGNGTSDSALDVGKALVRLATGAAVSTGDIVVSAGAEPGRAAADNTVTDPRKIVGFAVEPAGATLAGYVAILRGSR